MGKDLRVAYFAFSEEYGGKHAGFTHSYNLINALSRFVSISSFFYAKSEITEGGRFNAVIFPRLKNFLSINLFLYFNSYSKVKSIVRNVDIVHERFHVNPVDLLFISRKPYVLEINDPAMVLHDNFFYRFLINLKLGRCSCIITQTKTLKNILSKFTSKPIYVVPNGADIKKFRPDVKSDVRDIYGIKKGDVLVVFVGAFMQWHGTDDIIELAIRLPELKFLMVGNGPEYSNVRNKSKGLKNVIFAGSVDNDEVPKFLSAADILIAPFNTKKFAKMDIYGFWWCPVKIFEYLAAGRSVVGYDYIEVRNIVDGCGLLAKPNDFHDLLGKVKKLANNKGLRLNLGVRARKRSLRYDWKYRAMEVYKIYKKCLKK